MARAEVQLPAPPGRFAVEVVYCAKPGSVDSVPLRCEPGTTLGQAVQRSGLLQRHPELQAELRAGIWGKAQPPETALRERDRVELYRPLTVDPKEARRLRYRKQRQNPKPRPAAMQPAADLSDSPKP